MESRAAGAGRECLAQVFLPLLAIHGLLLHWRMYHPANQTAGNGYARLRRQGLGNFPGLVKAPVKPAAPVQGHGNQAVRERVLLILLMVCQYVVCQKSPENPAAAQLSAVLQTLDELVNGWPVEIGNHDITERRRQLLALGANCIHGQGFRAQAALVDKGLKIALAAGA